MEDVCKKSQNFSFSSNYKERVATFGSKMFHFNSFLPLTLLKHNLDLFTVCTGYKKIFTFQSVRDWFVNTSILVSFPF